VISLVFDSRERWFPVGVEESLEAVGVKVPRSASGYFPDYLRRDRLGRADRFDMESPDLLPAIGYKRELAVRGLRITQLWFWYLYNPKDYVGFGRHEGDWEMVQLAHSDTSLVAVSLAQHGTGETRFAWRGVEYDEDDNVVVYVARDSHACYFTPVRDLEDQADGHGKMVFPEWREFGAWKDWPGRWGNSGSPAGSGSPPSPGCQAKWRRPLQWMAEVL
jgi:hypothetical protein